MEPDEVAAYIEELKGQIKVQDEMLAAKNPYPVFLNCPILARNEIDQLEPGDEFSTQGAGIVTFVKWEPHPDSGSCFTWKLQCGSMYRTDAFGFHRFRNTVDDFNILKKCKPRKQDSYEEPRTDSTPRPAVEAP